jgi:hypothetical protein
MKNCLKKIFNPIFIQDIRSFAFPLIQEYSLFYKGFEEELKQLEK